MDQSGIEVDKVWWEIPSLPVGATDIYSVYLPQLYGLGIVVVCSAGNSPGQDLSVHYPRAAGGSNTPLIVVGNVQYNNVRHPRTGFRDRNQWGILSLMNIGTDVDCAVLTEINKLTVYPHAQDPGQSYRVDPPGSSQATAITAGMIAYLLGDPILTDLFMANGLGGLPMAAKNYLIDRGMSL